jgi:hypothetical protein
VYLEQWLGTGISKRAHALAPARGKKHGLRFDRI